MGWRAFGAIFLLVTSCDCGGGSGLTRLRPELVAYDPSIEGHPEIDSFDFGSVPFGSISRRPLGIRNIGGDRLTISSAAIDTPFSHDLTGEWIVEAGSERELTVAFEPRIDGEVTGELGLAHDGVNGPVARIALMGRGVEPKVDLSSEMLDFGAVTVDQRKELEVVLTNQTQFAQPFRVVPPVQDASIFGANP